MGKILIYVLAGYVLYLNIVAFNLFRVDKKKAINSPTERKEKKRYDRICERKLMSKCFFGGAIGGFFGMKIFRHKTQKWKFKIFVPVFLIAQLIIYSFVFGFLGYWVYLS